MKMGYQAHQINLVSNICTVNKHLIKIQDHILFTSFFNSDVFDFDYKFA